MPNRSTVTRLVLSLSLIFTIAFGIRIVNLNSLPIFADEAIYVRWAQIMRAEPSLRFLPLTDGKQPLYMWMVIPFQKVISDPLIAGRVLSGLAGLVIMAALVILGKAIFGRYQVGVFAAAIWAVLPYSVFFERMALVDAWLTAWFLWGFLFFCLAIKQQRLDWTLISGGMFGLAWLTKSPAMFGLALLPLSIFMVLPTPFKINNIIRSFLFTLIIWTIAFGMYNILRLGPQFHMLALRNLDYVFPLTEVISHPLNPLIFHLQDTLAFYLHFLTPLGLIMAAVAFFENYKVHTKSRLLLGLWWLLPVILQAGIARSFTARYLLYTVPFAVLLMAHSFQHIGDHTQKHILSRLSVMVLMVYCAVYSLFLIYNPQSAPLPRIERSGYLEEWTAGFGLREISQKIIQYSKSGPVLVGSEGFFGTPFDALGAYLNPYKHVRVVGLGNIYFLDAKLTNSLVDNQVFVVVNSSRLMVDPDKLGLELLSSYPKGVKPDGSREFALFFRVLPDFKR